MDNRFFLWAAVGLVWLMVYQAYQRDYAVRPDAATPSVSASQVPSEVPVAPPSSGLPTLPDAGTTTDPQIASPMPSQPKATGTVVIVTTDVLSLSIDTLGANPRDVKVTAYPKRKDEPDDVVNLLSSDPAKLNQIQSGIIAATDISAPNHETRYSAAKPSYEMGPNDQQLDVVFSWSNAQGISATKTYRFYRGRYNIDVEYVVSNAGSEEFRGAPYVQIQRKQTTKERSFTDVASYSFIGPVFYNGQAADKYKPKKLRKEPIDQSITGGWLATIRHHFLTAAIPDAADNVHYRSRVTDNAIEVLSAVSPVATVAAGASKTFKHTLFLGPKLQSQLEETASGLIRTVDYGVLSILSQPLFWLLNKIHSLVGNWGWSIIFVTLFVKLLFYPLAEKGGRSMAKMRTIAPRMKALQERHKDDRQALSRAMMDLYKREKVNPMSSCLPMLLQLPVFLALYWVLIESVELRQAPWILWITDLSSRDPFFILPLIMAGAMFVQTKLNPPPADPTTAKVMQIMPIMMSVFFAFFPAGLVLYWVMNTLLSVAQQWRINRVVEAEAKAKKAHR